MVELWRLGRNRYGRALYDRLTAAGVTATWMSEYRRSLQADVPTATAPVTAAVAGPDRVAPLDAPVGELVDGERVVAAVDGDEPVGYCFCSVDATLEIAPLERSLAFDGAYLRRVYVDPAHRERGVASALVAAACEWARDEGAQRATALVARDNVPSRALFESHGFEVVTDHRYVRVGPLSHRSGPVA